jgi:HEPN domain-containing protein
VLAEEYLRRAERYLKEARNAYAEGDFPTTIRRSQESVELSVKAALRLLGIEYPRKHDVSDVLDQIVGLEALPGYFREAVPFVQEVVRRLAMVRGIAMYGDEETLTQPSRIFKGEDALRSVERAERVLDVCRRLFNDWGGEKEGRLLLLLLLGSR